MRWTVLVPAKALPEAKSRLAAATTDPAAHALLVLAIRADTLSAAEAARNVARVVVVTDRVDAAERQPGVHAVIVQTRPGLNEALREAAGRTAQQWPQDGTAALVGDLPALRPEELADALDLAAREDAGFVVDAGGTGTTLLTAAPGRALRPSFGAGSAARHAATAVQLAAGVGLRHDVDTEADLWQALELGVGPATLAVAASTTFRAHLRRA